MNEKEIGELRRRIRPEKNNISWIHGCYVNEKREVVSVFRQPLSLMPRGELEEYLLHLRKTLTGTLGKNLIDIAFDTRQVVDSDEHRLLMSLRDSDLKDEETVRALYEKMIPAIDLEGNYLILLVSDRYDVPYRSRDDETQADAGEETFSYILCAVCPVKATKSALSYFIMNNEFHTRDAGWDVAAPELGFLFPAFDDRGTNLYGALYYTRDVAESHAAVVDAVFRTEAPKPAAEQKRAFEVMLGQSLEEDCSLDVVQTVHERLSGMIALHKESKVPEPLRLSRQEMGQVLEECGVSDERLTAFSRYFDEEFGTDAAVSPRNIIDQRRFEVRTPEIIVQVDPEHSDLIETRVIDGRKYILIPAGEGVEVNGVPIRISGE